MSPENVVAAARAAHFAYWRMTGDESAGDKLAAQVTRQWQQTVCSSDSSRFHAEAAVAPHLHERLDLVDTRDGVAYELKVSPNNAHFEFYRDVFKALVAQRYSIPQLKRLV